MKKSLILLPLAAVLLSLTGCKKDNEKSGPSGETVTFTANIGGGEKTEIYDGTKMKWSYGDKITINGDVFTSDFPMGDYTTANFVGTFTTPAPTEYKAYYPQTLYDEGSDKYVLPATQTYNGSILSGINPMYAYQSDVDNKTLQFHNICALVKLKVTGTGTVRTIVVTSDNPLCGEFEPKTDDNVHYYAKVAESGSKTLTLNCGAGVDLNATTSTTFYIALPQGELGNLTFKVGESTLAVVNANLTAGKLYTKTLEDVEAPVIEFSVSTTQKVKFAPGNLWYGKAGGETTAAFHFETNQWDYCVNDPHEGDWGDLIGTWNPSHVSHFYWSATESVAYAQDYSDESTSTSDVFFTNSSSFQVSGETAGTWRTLSEDEWNYLLGYDPDKYEQTDTYGRLNAMNLCAWVMLTDVNVYGLVILPDGSDATASGVTTSALVSSSGAVFLPAAGIRGGTDVSNVGLYGFYWSSTSDEDCEYNVCYSYYTFFTSGYVSTGLDATGRGGGYAVRLVR